MSDEKFESPIFQTVQEMFTQREYENIEYNPDENTFTGNSDKGYVKAYMTIIDKLNVAEIHSKIDIMQKDPCKHIILIYDNTPTPTVKNVISSTNNIGLTIELFYYLDLMYNPTKHILVPLHQKLNQSDAKEFKEKFGKAIPVILRSDPITRFYNFAKGDIIRVTRRNGIIAYRIVK